MAARDMGTNDLTRANSTTGGPTTDRDRADFLLKLLESSLKLRSEVADETLDGPGSGVTQSANGVAFNLLGKLPKHVDFTGTSLAVLESVHDLQEPGGALSAGCALTAGLVLIEVRETLNGADNVGALVQDNDGSGTQTRLVVLKIVVVHENVLADVLGQDRDGAATGNNTKKVVPAAANATAVLLEKLSERN